MSISSRLIDLGVPPLGVAGWVDGTGGGWGELPHMYAHVNTHILIKINMLGNIGNFYACTF